MAWLYRYSILHPRRVLWIAAAITLLIAPGALRLELRTDGHALVPVDAPEIRVDRTIRERFGVADSIVMVVRSEHPDGLFNAHTLALVQEFTHDFQGIGGIGRSDVSSLATEYSDRVKPGTLEFRPFLTPLPSTPETLDRLRSDLRAIELYNGTLVSYDENATSILVSVPGDVDRLELYRTIVDLVEGKGPLPEEIHVIGAPVAESLLGTHLLADLGVPSALLGHRPLRVGQDYNGWRVPRSVPELRGLLGRQVGLVPIALAVMAIVFVVSFRSLTAALLPLSEVGACLIFVFALMGWCGVPVYLTIAVLPVILTAVGVADEIHVFRRYVEELRTQPSAVSGRDPDRDREGAVRNPQSAIRNPQSIIHNSQAVLTTMSEMSTPIVKTSLTTAVGFLSFTLSPIAAVQAFGVFTSIGIIFCMIWSLTVIPALLVLIRPSRFVKEGDRRRLGSQRAEDKPASTRPVLIPFFLRHRHGVLIISAVVVLVAALGVRRVVVQDSWIDGFARTSEFHQATRRFNEEFLGSHVLLVCVDAGHEALSGKIVGSAVHRRELRLPADLTPDPQTLIGQQIQLRLAGDSNSDPPIRDATARESRNRDATVRERAAREHQPPFAGRRSPGRRTEWTSLIEQATSDGDSIVIHTSREKGFPRLSLQLSDAETLVFEITPRRLQTPDVLERIGDLEAFIEAHREDAVGGVLGPAKYIATTNFLARGRAEGSRRIPLDPHGIGWLWEQYGRIRGTDRLAQVVNPNRSRGLITVFLKDANFVATSHLMDDLREYEKAELRPHGLSLTFGGDVAVSQTLISAIVSTQVTSLLVSLVGILATTALLSRSLGWGLYSLLPCALAVLINFAVMGWIGVPLGVATSMFAGMTLGIGVDYAIHLLERYKLACRRGLDLEAALADAVAATGPAVFIDAAAVALGFGILMLSQVPANARLGGLLVLSIVNCLVATLVLLPVLVRTWSPRITASE